MLSWVMISWVYTCQKWSYCTFEICAIYFSLIIYIFTYKKLYKKINAMLAFRLLSNQPCIFSKWFHVFVCIIWVLRLNSSLLYYLSRASKIYIQTTTNQERWIKRHILLRYIKGNSDKWKNMLCSYTERVLV